MSPRSRRKRGAARQIIPSTPGERQENGKFAPGNRIGGAVAGARAAPGNHKHRFLTQQLISRLHETNIEDKRGRRQFEILVDKLVERAVKDGDMDAIKFIFERVDGKMVQPVETNDISGMTFTLKIGHRSPEGGETVIEARRENNGRKRVSQSFADPDAITDQDRRDFGEL